jgi:hypothetical protein
MGTAAQEIGPAYIHIRSFLDKVRRAGHIETFEQFQAIYDRRVPIALGRLIIYVGHPIHEDSHLQGDYNLAAARRLHYLEGIAYVPAHYSGFA